MNAKFKPTRLQAAAGAIALAAVVLATYSLNGGCMINPFKVCKFEDRPSFAVLVVGAHVGFLPLFCLTAAAGSLGLIALGKAIQRSPFLEFIGKNTLGLLFINGLFFSLAYSRLGVALQPWSAWWIPICTLVVLIHLAVIVPVAPLVDRLRKGSAYISELLIGLSPIRTTP